MIRIMLSDSRRAEMVAISSFKMGLIIVILTRF